MGEYLEREKGGYLERKMGGYLEKGDGWKSREGGRVDI